MRYKAGMKFDCILEEPLDFIDINYTHLNKTIRYEQRQHGEWIGNRKKVFVMCSICKAWHKLRSNYCPDCGADMRGEK